MNTVASASGLVLDPHQRAGVPTRRRTAPRYGSPSRNKDGPLGGKRLDRRAARRSRRAGASPPAGRSRPYLQAPAVMTEAGLFPAATVAVAIGVRPPPAPMVYCETVRPRFATYGSSSARPPTSIRSEWPSSPAVCRTRSVAPRTPGEAVGLGTRAPGDGRGHDLPRARRHRCHGEAPMARHLRADPFTLHRRSRSSAAVSPISPRSAQSRARTDGRARRSSSGGHS